MTSLEQELVNIGALLAQTLATAAAAKNPAYASVIATGNATLAAVNSAVNPNNSATATTLSSDVVAAIQPATAAISTLMNKTSTPTQKATAIAGLLGEIEQLVPEAVSVIESIFKKPAPVQVAAVAPVS